MANRTHARLSVSAAHTHSLTLMLLCALMFALSVWTTAAQETTPVEATPELEITPTEEPVLATEVPVILETPAPEATLEVTAEATDVAPITVTDSPTVTTTALAPVLLDTLTEDFEAFTGDGWALNGWAVGIVDANTSLQTAAAASSATITTFVQPAFDLTALLSVAADNTASIRANGYEIMFDSLGNSRLYQNAVVVATSPASDTTDALVTPFTVQVSINGTTVSVAVNSTPQFTYTDVSAATALPTSISFVSGDANTGIVSLDNLSVTRLEPSIVIAPEIIITEGPSETPALEATEIAVEATSEATEVAAEATEVAAEVVVPEVAPFLTADFESDAAAIVTTGSIVATDDTNHALLLATTGTLAPATDAQFIEAQIIADVQLLAEDAEIAFVIGGNSITLTPVRIGAFNNPFVDVALTPNTWANVIVTVRGDVLTVVLNGEPVYNTPIVPAAGKLEIAVMSGSTLLDNVILTDYAPQTVATSPDVLAKGNGALGIIMQALATGDTDAVTRTLADYTLATDELGRISIEIGTINNEVIPVLGETIATLGGVVHSSSDYMIYAHVPVSVLVDLALDASVYSLRASVSAASTSLSEAPSEAPTGPLFSDGMNVVGALDWHNKGALGQNVKIAVIDRGFGDGSSSTPPPNSGEYACINAASVYLPTGVVAGDTISNHGRSVVEVLCDMAPSATVYMYAAKNYDTLARAIERARTDAVNIIAITMDLGVDSSPGDGQGIGGTYDPYDQIQLAKANGIVIFAAAGNNGAPASTANADKAWRYYTYTASGAATFNLRVTAGDVVRVGYNGWNDGGASNFTMSLSTGGSTSRLNPSVAGNSLTVSGTCPASCTPFSSTLTITPGSSFSGRIVQVQVAPTAIAGESQSVDVGITSVSGAAVVANYGTLARPADSADVIAVGAVCADDEGDFAPLPDASVGPVYGTGGAASLIVFPAPTNGFQLSQVKPEIVAPSVVRTSQGQSDNAGFCDGSLAGSNDDFNYTGLFGGSSAATAHAAGMAALLKSNTTNTSMSIFNVGGAVNGAQAVQNIENYLITHSAELPLEDDPFTAVNEYNTLKGYDMQYGAGVAMLGLPQYPLTNTTNFSVVPDDLPTACTVLTTRYVGQANGASLNNGTLANPYTNIGTAVKLAVTNDCIVVMPGDYVTPVLVNNTANNVSVSAWDTVDSADTANSLIRITGQYYGLGSQVSASTGVSILETGGFTVKGGSGAFALRGFNFVPALRYSYKVPPPNESVPTNLRDPQAVAIIDADNVTIANNTFGMVTVDSIDYTGWVAQEASPVVVAEGSTAATIEQNTFIGNSATSESVAPTISVVSSAALIRRNEFTDNSNSDTGSGYNGIMQFDDSSVSLVGNSFTLNKGNALIITRTPTQSDTTPTYIVSNVFNNNTGSTTLVPGATVPTDFNAGLVTTYYARYLYFVNNTVVQNTYGSTSGAVILRGPATDVAVPWNDGNNQKVDIHNNLFYSNTFGGGIYDYQVESASGCLSNGAAATGVTYNWFAGALTSAHCTITGNGNKSGVAATTAFIGGDNARALGFSLDDYRYWALNENDASAKTNAIDEGADFTKTGLPSGAENFQAPFDLDAISKGRSVDIQDDLQNGILNVMDIGAFEFSPLAIDDGPGGDNNIPTIYAVTLPEDNGTLTIPVVDFVKSGFGSLKFSIATACTDDPLAIPPLQCFVAYDDSSVNLGSQSISKLRNFGTGCGPEFTGTQGVIFGTGSNSGTISYCPPDNFYNSTLSDPAAKIDIFYTVTDEALSSKTGKIEVTITPVADTPLTASLGDEVPADDIAEVILLAGQTITVPLRPTVTYGNFEWSEEFNDEFNAPGPMVDYPFSFSNKTESGTSGGYSDVVTSTLSGGILTIVAGQQRGTERITYRVTDANGNSTTANEIRVRVTSVIPAEPGIYDDSSIYWNFVDGLPAPANTVNSWTALQNPKAINNTLHQSAGAQDRAEFIMIGTGFVIYMQGTSNGATYNLEVKGTDATFRIPAAWIQEIQAPALTTSLPKIFKSTITLDDDGTGTGLDGDLLPEVLTCFARTSGIGSALSNVGTLPYSIYCNFTDASPTEQLLTVSLKNLTATTGTIAVDAFSIINDTAGTNGGPLAPGIYDVDSQEVRGIFYSSYPSSLKTGWAEYRFATLLNGIGYRATGNGAAAVSFQVEGATGVSIGSYNDARNGSVRLCVEATNTGGAPGVTVGNKLCQIVDLSPLNTTPTNTTLTTYNAFIPFYGLNPLARYQITLDQIDNPVFATGLPTSFIVDTIRVFGPADKTNGVLPNGTTENDQLQSFVYGGGTEDAWSYNGNATTSSNRTLHTTVTTPSQVGSFVAFDIAADADSFVYDFLSASTSSRRLMFCVDRAALAPAASNAYGNCLIVNTRPTTADPVSFYVMQPDGTLLPNTDASLPATTKTYVIQPSQGTLAIRQALFADTTWNGIDTGGSNAIDKHTVEVFSLTNEQLNLDRVSIYSATGALPAGIHEDIIAGMRYFEPDTNADNLDDEVTPSVYTPANPLLTYTATTTSTNTFLIHNGSYGARDSGRSVMWTKKIGASVAFGVDGTGFAPRFRWDANSDAVSVCYLQTSSPTLPNPFTIRNTGTCQIFDNQGATSYTRVRPILGLEDTSGSGDARYYAVAITLLPDDLSTVTHSTSPYMSMWFDGVVVYNTPWTTLTPLAVNVKTEASYLNRVARNQFTYFGSVWTSSTLTSNTTWSNFDYDLSRAQIGAGVVFRTTGADAINIRRNMTTAYGNLLVCAAPESNPLQRLCTTVVNNTPVVTGNILTVLLNETGSTVPHIVSIVQVGLTDFALDAITPINTTTPLVAGKYDDGAAGIRYVANAQNLVFNGNQEADNLPITTHWGQAAPFWTIVGGPASNIRGGVAAFQPTYARTITINNPGDGIESRSFNLIANRTYIISARVWNDGTGGDITMTLEGASSPAFTPVVKGFLATKQWQTIYTLYTPTVNTTVKLRFTSTVTAATPAARRFAIDDVGVYERGRSNWSVVLNAATYGKTYSRSSTPGAEATFAFTGTGFRVGMILDTTGGATEVCYGIGTPTNCFTYENERSAIATNVSRSIAGLPSGTYQVRIRDVEEGNSVLLLSDNLTRRNPNQMGRLSIDFVEVFNSALPPVITQNIQVNEDYKITGANALQLLPTNGWKTINSTAYSNGTYAQIIDQTTGLASSIIGGYVGVMQLDLTNAATVILFSDAPSTAKTDQLLYCVNGVDGSVKYDFTNKVYVLFGSTKCQLTNKLRTLNQAVLTLPDTNSTAVLTFTSLTPAPLNIDGYRVLLGTELSQGYYETNLSEATTNTCTNLISGGCVGTTGGAAETYEAFTPTNWYKQSSSVYSGGNTLVLEDSNFTLPTVGAPIIGAPSQLTFNLKQATGFSLITSINTNGGTFTVTAYDGSDTFTFNGTTLSTSALNQVSIPFTGLPIGDYVVTIENTGAKNLFVDAIEVYGPLQVLGSLYDDNQKTPAGIPLITYAPSNGKWALVEGASAVASLNSTYHVASTLGAVAMFEAGTASNQATGVTVIYSQTTSSKLKICYRNLGSPALTETCGTSTVVNSTTGGRLFQAFPAPGRYAVTVVNDMQGRFQLDAVQVAEEGGLTEGIYGVAQLRSNNGNLANAFIGDNILVPTSSSWTIPTGNSPATATSKVNNATFTFVMNGTGFSILVNETTATAATYSLCVDKAGGSTCDTIGNAGNPLTISRSVAPNGLVALTYVGLHTVAGADETYTVTLVNTDLTVPTQKTMTIAGVHILGAKTDAASKLTDSLPRAENTDVRLRYLPFGWAINTIDRTNAASGASQHIGIRNGGVAYFEFTGTFEDFEIVRQVASTFADAVVCTGFVGDTAGIQANNTTNCKPLDNNGLGAAFGRSDIISTGLTCNSAQGCWVAIRSTENAKQFVLDYVRLLDPNAPLTAGLYEENFKGLRNFSSVSTPTLIPTGEGTLNIQPRVSVPTASGSFVRRFTALFVPTAPLKDNTTNSGVAFTIEGTGFSVLFTTDPFQDAVRICYAPSAGTLNDAALNAVLTTGVCQTYDNQSATTAYKVRRSFLGLPFDQYHVVVQMLADNNTPATHAVSAAPLRMDFDAVEVYNNNWFEVTQTNWLSNAQLNAITPASGRLETSYTNRLTDKNLQYYGTWTSVTSTTSGGGSYDSTLQAGAGVVFRTANANAATIYVNLAAANSEIFICATPLNALNPLVETAARFCREYPTTGIGTQQPISFQFNGGLDEYVVSVTSKRNVAFQLDAIQVFDTTAPLVAARYEATDARIAYDQTYTNYVPNGNMEAPGAWSSIKTRIVPPATVASIRDIPPYRFAGVDGTYVRRDIAKLNDGIQSNVFTVPTTGTYLFAARAYLEVGSMQMRLREDGVVIYTKDFITPIRQWLTLRLDRTFTAGKNYQLEFVGLAATNTFSIDGVEVTKGGIWRYEYLASYSASSIVRSLTTGATASFSFTGTGFELGMLNDTFGGEVEICYGIGTPTNCFIYQNESSAVRPNVARTVAGLTNGTYVVRVRDLEDGLRTYTSIAPRANTTNIGRIAIDYLRIFDNAPIATMTPGIYNENALNSSNAPYLQTLPTNRWKAFTGSVAAAYSNTSYVTTVTDTGVASALYAGQTVIARINKQAGRAATVILYLGPVNATRSDQLLICAGNATTGSLTWNGTIWSMPPVTGLPNCVLRTNMRTATQVVVNGGELAALGTLASGLTRVSFTTLTPGRFDVDGIQFISGDALASGLNDDLLAPPATTNVTIQNNSLVRFGFNNKYGVNTNTTAYNASNLTGCNRIDQWCQVKNSAAIAGTFAQTAAPGATLTFNFEGTGFSLYSIVDTLGLDMRICYKRAANTTDFPAGPSGGTATTLDTITLGQSKDTINLAENSTSGIWCDRRSTSTNAILWGASNGSLINPGSGNRYGFAYYGLPFGRYSVQVTVVDNTVSDPTTERLVIDAIAVFGNGASLPALAPGLYDNTASAFGYEPTILWNTVVTTTQPPTGAYGLSERTSTVAGTIVQLRVMGNAVTFFQTLNRTGSRDVQLCFLVRNAQIHCNEIAERSSTGNANGNANAAWQRALQLAQWSQLGTGRMSPVMIYGLGSGTHQLILENRDHNRILSVDAVLVQP